MKTKIYFLLGVSLIYFNYCFAPPPACTTTISGAVFNFSSTNELPTTTVLCIESMSVVNLSGFDQNIRALNYESDTFTSSGATLTLNGSGGDTVLSMRNVTLPTSQALGAVNLTGGGIGSTIEFDTTDSGTATIAASLGLGSAPRIFDIPSGAATTDMNVSGAISGAGTASLTKTSAGLLRFSGGAGSANTYSGITTVSAGTLVLGKTAGVTAIAGNVRVSAGTLRLDAANQIANTSRVTLDGGTFNMNGFAETINDLVFNSGALVQGGGVLSLASTGTALSMQGVTTIAGTVALTGASGGNVRRDLTGGDTATISGTLGLGSVTRAFIIEDGAGDPDMEITGVVSGTGGITKLETGNLRFSGGSANTYTGLTTVSMGTLTLAKSPSVISIPGNVTITGGILLLDREEQIVNSATMTLGGGTFDMAGFAETIDNLIFNSGTLTQGGGVLSLANNSGTALTMRDTTITGTVALTGGSLGSVRRDATNNGTAIISGVLGLGSVEREFNIENGDSSIDMNVSGVISGTGGVIKRNTGTLFFTGGSANTYTGLTTVSAGTLGLQKTAGITAIPGDLLINGGTVTLDAANQIADTSDVTLSSGTFEVDNTETIHQLTFTGGTMTQAADLTIGTPGTIAVTMRNVTIPGQLNIAGGPSESAIVFDNTNGGGAVIQSIDLGGVNRAFNIGGANGVKMTVNGSTTTGGGIVKLGPGTLRLAGTHALAGSDSAIRAGKVLVTGDWTTDTLLVNAAGTVGGTGTITTDMTLNGTIQPGLSIGTISLVGDQVFGSTSTAEIEISPTASDLIDITGGLTINAGATLSVIPELGMYPSSFTYTIIQTTTGVTGVFTNVLNDMPLFDFEVIYNPNNVQLQLSRLPFSFLILGGNPGRVAKYLDGLSPANGSDLAFVFGVLETLTSIEALRDALNQMHPAPLKGLALVQENNALRFRSAIIERASDPSRQICKCYDYPCGWSVWANVTGDFNDQDTDHRSTGDNIGFDSWSVLPMIGFDYQTSSNVVIGGALGYSYSDLSWKRNGGTGEIQSGYASLYATWFNNCFFIDGVLLGAYNHYDEKRNIKFSLIDRRTKANFDGAEFLGHLDLGFVLPWKKLELRPFVSIDYIYMYQCGFTESGAQSLNIKVESSDYDLLREEVGLEFGYCLHRFYHKLLFEAKASYIREDRFHGKSYRANFKGEPGSFRAVGIYPNRNLFSPAVAVTHISWDERCYATVRYEAEIGSHYWDQNVNLQFIYKF